MGYRRGGVSEAFGVSAGCGRLMPVLRLAYRVLGMGRRGRIGRLAGGSGVGAGRVVALGGAMLLAPPVANEALAACVLSGGSYVCSGDTASAVVYNTDALTVVLDNTFNNTVTVSPAAIDLTVPTSGDLNLTTQTGSSISGASFGIRTTNNGGGASTMNIAGTVDGTAGVGVYAYNDYTTTDLTISQFAGSVISGTTGISTSNNGSGATTINVAGTVTATSSTGVGAYNGNSATDLTII